jgi:hypothetical protein
MIPVNRYPAGFLQLLDSQVEGKTPRAVSDTIAPTLELRDHLEAVLIQGNGVADASITTINQSITLEVPQNETWKLLSVGVNGTLALVGQTIQMSVLLGLRNGTVVVAGFPAQTSTVAGELYRYGQLVPQPILLVPGTTIIARIGKIVLNGAPSMNLSLHTSIVKYGVGTGNVSV